LHTLFKAKGVPNGGMPMKPREWGVGSGEWVGKRSDLERFFGALVLNFVFYF